MAPGGMRGGGRGGGRGRGMSRGRRFGRGMGAGRGRGAGSGMDPGPGEGQMGNFGTPVQQPGPLMPDTQRQGEVERLREVARQMERQKAEVERQIQEAESGKVTGPVKLKPIVDETLCTGCGICLEACPADAIVLVDGMANISDECTACGACVAECPNDALAMGPA